MIVDRLKALCKEKGVTFSQFEKESGIGLHNANRWDKSSPSVWKVKMAADYFGVTVSTIIGEDGGATPQDTRLISAYHRATPADRAIIDNIVDRYADAVTEPVVLTKVIPLFGTSAAAGPGEPDTELPWQDYEVPQDSAAEFAVRITGDSMAPELEDGQIALCVKRRPRVGDLAVLMVNGSMLVKQYINDFYGNVYLRSLNRKRQDCDYDIMASGNDTVMCFGIVLVDHKIPLVD